MKKEIDKQIQSEIVYQLAHNKINKAINNTNKYILFEQSNYFESKDLQEKIIDILRSRNIKFEMIWKTNKFKVLP